MTKVCKIMRVECFVVNSSKKEDFENVLNMLMVPIRAYDEASNTYTIHVTYNLWKYILRECRFREIEVLPQTGYKHDIVNKEVYDEYRAEKKKAA